MYFIVGRPESSGDSIKLQIEEAYSPDEIRLNLMRSVKIYLILININEKQSRH